jgi:hypothetical protein
VSICESRIGLERKVMSSIGGALITGVLNS